MIYDDDEEDDEEYELVNDSDEMIAFIAKDIEHVMSGILMSCRDIEDLRAMANDVVTVERTVRQATMLHMPEETTADMKRKGLLFAIMSIGTLEIQRRMAETCLEWEDVDE